MDHTCIIDAFGRMFINPDDAAIESHLDELFTEVTKQCPLRDISLTHYQSGYSLIYYDNKILTLENINEKEEPVRFISNVALNKAYDLFLALNKNQIKRITSLSWEIQ
ncbi:MAG: hypothetical protein P8I61_03500 [Opitutae bacterium]|jgi:hypothetical protein|nr:hypothetical protein [Opitutae bacterium]